MTKNTLAILSLALLVGCARPSAPTLSQETKFTSETDKAIVVLGFGCDTLEAHHCKIAGRNLIEGKVKLRESDNFQIGDWKTNGLTLFRALEPVSIFKRSAFEVTPGEYAITEISNQFDRKTYVTNIFKDDTYYIKFKAEAGKINYIGDFYVNARVFPARIVKYTVDTQVTKDYVQKFPGVQGDLLVQKLNVSAPALEGVIR